MREVLRTNDLVLISYALHVLSEAGIAGHVFDTHTSAIEGSIGALPRRIMVEEDDYRAARRLLHEISGEEGSGR